MRSLSFLLMLGLAPLATAQTNPGDPKEELAETADGVKLRCRFYAAQGEGNGSCVILLTDYLANPDTGDWDGLARFLAKDCAMNVVRFDWRGHGQSKEVIPEKFWKEDWNMRKVSGANKRPAKSTIDYKDFKSDYYPMLVNDLAAVRNLLDIKNDNRNVNTRSVYLIAAGSSAPLVNLFLAVEWQRQQTKPEATGVVRAIEEIVRVGGYRQPNTEVAGNDYAGVVYLSPTATYKYEYGTSKGSTRYPTQTIKDFVSKYSKDARGGANIRTTTAMLFLVGEKDFDGEKDAKFFSNDVMAIDGKASPKLEAMKNSKLVLLKGAKEKGVDMLGKSATLKTEEQIKAFLAKVEGDRKKLNTIDRKYTKPFGIALSSFGINN